MIEFLDLGLKPYKEALKIQEELRQKRIAGEIFDTLILCEHPPVFTVGKRDADGDFLSTFEKIFADGIEVVKTERGGRITYHGPGQLVGYFIFNIKELGLGVKDFVNKVEECCVLALQKFGIDAVRDPLHPGLWVNGEKIVAVGLNITQGVSMHGFALNVAPDMVHYKHIVPCGIKDRGITSMDKLLERTPAMADVAEAVKNSVNEVFGAYFISSTAENVRFDSSVNTFSTSAFLDSSGSEFKKVS